MALASKYQASSISGIQFTGKFLHAYGCVTNYKLLNKLEYPASKVHLMVDRLSKDVGGHPVLLPRAGNFISMSNNKPLSRIKASENRQRYHGPSLPT